MKPTTRKIPTPQSLANAALHYLSRYAASEASLRQVLRNRLRRAAMQHPEFADDNERKTELNGVIEQLVEKYKKSGILNDAAFAEAKVKSLRREGRSRRAILQKLGLKGISGSLVAEALQKNADEISPEEAEENAARAFMRRRKMGPFRKTPVDVNVRRKDLAALARAGFSLDIARRVLNAEILEDDA
jgi:regulatory protein